MNFLDLIWLIPLFPAIGFVINGLIGKRLPKTVVGIIAAKVGEKVLDWLASIWMIRLQIATSLLIVGMGVVLTIRAVSELATLPTG